MEHIIGYRLLTAQEGTEGGCANLRNLRQDLYKKICSADPISRRLPYAKSSKMVSLRGMLRFELNQPLTFNNVRGEQWGSIYRRSLVVKMKAKFTPLSEYDAIRSVDKEDMGSSPSATRLSRFSKADLQQRPSSGLYMTS